MLQHISAVISFWQPRRPPAKAVVANVIAAAQTVSDALQDSTVAPFLAASVRSATDDETSDEWLSQLPHQLETLVNSLRLKPPPSAKGRAGLHPDMHEVATILTDYYVQQTGKPASTYFKIDNAEDPGNEFTSWFCSTLPKVLPDRGITNSACKTLLAATKSRQRHPKK